MTERQLKVLFLTHRLPYAPNRGDRTRSYHMLRVLVSKTDVTLVSLVSDSHEASKVEELRGIAPKVAVAAIPRWMNLFKAVVSLPSARPLTTLLLESPAIRPAIRRLVADDPPDVVLAFCSSMAHFALEPPLDRFPLVVDMVDADSAKWGALSATRAWPMSWLYRREARTLSVLESRAMRKAIATTAVNTREVELLRHSAPDARIDVLGNGVDVDRFRPAQPPSPAPRAVFTGVMNYEPNETGAIWLGQQVWPRVRALVPGAELRIVGASPTRRVLALHDESRGVSVVGRVPDMRPELWSAAVAVAPLHTARGVQNKVLEAVAAGLPCVVTSAVREGLPTEVLPACTTADEDQDFAEAIVAVLRQVPSERRAQAAVDLSPLTWERRLDALVPLLTDAAGRS
jgi:sugar transferase (PEP-CTERM/EpsH1 system associated)